MLAFDELSRVIATALQGTPPLGYIRGKTLMRGALINHLDCSEVEAELLVDRLETRGFVRFIAHPAAETTYQGIWSIASPPPISSKERA
jgi:hypothetical protein